MTRQVLGRLLLAAAALTAAFSPGSGAALAGGAAAQTRDTTGVDPAIQEGNELLTELAGSFWQIRRLRTQMGQVAPWERDGLGARIDERGLAWLADLREAVAVYDTDGGSADEPAPPLPDTLRNLVREGMLLAAERDEELTARIGEERRTFGRFEQSPQADIARAFVEDLVRTRLNYLVAFTSLLDALDQAGVPTAGQETVIRERVLLVVERLTGQIQLDAASLDDLGSRLSDDSQDPDLRAAVTLLQGQQNRNLENLEALIPSAERLGIDVVEQRGLVIRERGAVDVNVLQRDVFRTLWSEQWSRFRANLARNGPNILFRLVLFLLIVGAAWLVSRPVRLVTRYLVDRERFELSTLVRELVVSVAGITVIVVGFLLALTSVGVSLGPALAGLGVAGLVIGLAVQDSLANLAAGVMILVGRPFDLHDFVTVTGAEGRVRRMNLLATTIATIDNKAVTVPNGRIWGDNIVNHTANRARRVDIPVSFAFSEDPDRVRDILMDLLENHEAVLTTPEPLVHMEAMGDSAVVMMAKPWVRTEDYWTALWELRRLIKQRLDAEGIEIPFPQRVVTIRREEDRP